MELAKPVFPALPQPKEDSEVSERAVRPAGGTLERSSPRRPLGGGGVGEGSLAIPSPTGEGVFARSPWFYFLSLSRAPARSPI